MNKIKAQITEDLCIHGTTKEDCKKCQRNLSAEIVYKKEPMNKKPKYISREDYVNIRRLF